MKLYIKNIIRGLLDSKKTYKEEHPDIKYEVDDKS